MSSHVTAIITTASYSKMAAVSAALHWTVRVFSTCCGGGSSVVSGNILWSVDHELRKLTLIFETTFNVWAYMWGNFTPTLISRCLHSNSLFIAVRKISARGKLHWTRLNISAQSQDWMQIGPDFKIQCILYDKQQNPDCAVRIVVKRALAAICSCGRYPAPDVR